MPSAGGRPRRHGHGACHARRQPHLLCAASTGASDTEVGSVCTSAVSSTASQELASRLSAPSAVQHSTDVRPQSAATASADTASPAADNATTCSNGAGNGGEVGTERSHGSSSRGQHGSGRRPADQDEQRPAHQDEQPPESGVLAHAQFGDVLSNARGHRSSRGIPTDAALTTSEPASGRAKAKALFLPNEKSQIRDSWRKIMRWSKVSHTKCWVACLASFRSIADFRQSTRSCALKHVRCTFHSPVHQVFNRHDGSILEATQKVVIFGGGSFGTAVGAALARQKADLDVTMLLRDPYVCQDINTVHRNRRYLDVSVEADRCVHSGAFTVTLPFLVPSLPGIFTDVCVASETQEFTLPSNVRATTSVAEALADAQFAVHAVPVQHSRRFLDSIKV